MEDKNNRSIGTVHNDKGTPKEVKSLVRGLEMAEVPLYWPWTAITQEGVGRRFGLGSFDRTSERFGRLEYEPRRV